MYDVTENDSPDDQNMWCNGAQKNAEKKKKL